jgi:hypothetical protein
MQQHAFGNSSEMVQFAAYDKESQTLYLTYHSGSTTVAYSTINQSLFDELRRSPYPDVCIRFKIQAQHAFRRVDPVVETYDYGFLK